MPPKSPYRGRRSGSYNDDENFAPYPSDNQASMPEAGSSRPTTWDTSPTRASAWEAASSRAPSQQHYQSSSRGQGQYRRAPSSRSQGQQWQTQSTRAHAPRWQPAASRGSGQGWQTSLTAGQGQPWNEPSFQTTQFSSVGGFPQPEMMEQQQPQPSEQSTLQSTPQELNPEFPAQKKKKNKNRKNRQRKRRQSFAAPSDTTEASTVPADNGNLPSVPETQAQAASAFYRLGNQDMGSNTSLESETLLDHRTQNQNPARLRRPSTHQNVPSTTSRLTPLATTRSHARSSRPSGSETRGSAHHSAAPTGDSDESDEDDEEDGRGEQGGTERTPLISRRRSTRSKSQSKNYGVQGTPQHNRTAQSSRRRKQSPSSSISSRHINLTQQVSTNSIPDEYDVNNPPSRPESPRLVAERDYDDVLLPDYSEGSRRFPTASPAGEAIINIGEEHEQDEDRAHSPDAGYLGTLRRRGTDQSPVEDVCIPFEQMTEIGEEDDSMQQHEDAMKRRRRKRIWPDLSALEEWSQQEKEELSQEGVSAKRVDEPVVVGGRLRPQKGAWRREVEEAPFRWTYFNEEMDTSLRSHTISGLQQLGHSFKELFIPDPPEIDDSSSDEEDDISGPWVGPDPSDIADNGKVSRVTTRQSSLLEPRGSEAKVSSGDNTPQKTEASNNVKPKRYGPRPVFWLDVLQPSWEEMRVLSRAFGIHKLTAEDIMEQEAREKVELFRTYYFVNYRTFEQDDKSEDYMDPVNMYFVVFKGGVISFHFSQMPHPPNVRRRIRQLAEHQYTDSDWIAYAIIDNITDAYAPVIEQIEKEVDEIDDEILQLNSRDETPGEQKKAKSVPKSIKDAVYEKIQDNEQQQPAPDVDRDMLLRVGECRKRVMSLYRLLGNKADVIKGLAKRCNEQWEVAPRSDVGLYLGDIQDHLVTMSSNLTHYENILSRAHSNYLAQINIGMNERAEKTADVLGKLTVLGTIVLPMNVVTGLWGMNCLVPGQVEDHPNLIWFFSLTAFLILFGFSSFFVTKKVYGIV